MWYSTDSQLAVAAAKCSVAARRTLVDAACIVQGMQNADAREAILRPSLMPPQMERSNWTNSTARRVISSRNVAIPNSVSLPHTGMGLRALTIA